MFKKCKKSVCSSNSIVVTPNSRKITVLHHSKSENASANECSNQGTNLWLKSGGVLPLVAVDPTTKELPSQQPVKKSSKAVKAHTVSKQTTKHHARQLTEKPSHTKPESPSQAVLKPLNTTFSVEKSSKEQPAKRKEEHPVFNKENYLNIISHFNERYSMDSYNPAEYCERKHSQTTPCVTRPHQATTAPETVHYSEEAKAEILLSIREELKSWRSEDKARENEKL